jgi:tRNA A37 methylthiotransferase MiaB
MRTPDSLAAELRLLKGLLPSNPQVGSLEFTDDNIFISPKRVSEVCQTLIDSKINLLWSGLIRATSVTHQNIGIIKTSQLMVPSIGVESGDLDQLQRMMKKATPEQLKTGIELLDGTGAAVRMFFIVGYPGETDQTIANTANFINSLNTRLARYTVFPFQVSPLSPVAMPHNRQKFRLYGIGDRWRHQTMEAEHSHHGCKTLCEQVSDVPYDYLGENILFNARFMGDRLTRLLRLRNQMTVQVLEGYAWDTVSETLADMAETMGLGRRYPAPSLKDEVVCIASGLTH